MTKTEMEMAKTEKPLAFLPFLLSILTLRPLFEQENTMGRESACFNLDRRPRWPRRMQCCLRHREAGTLPPPSSPPITLKPLEPWLLFLVKNRDPNSPPPTPPQPASVPEAAPLVSVPEAGVPEPAQPQPASVPKTSPYRPPQTRRRSTDLPSLLGQIRP